MCLDVIFARMGLMHSSKTPLSVPSALRMPYAKEAPTYEFQLATGEAQTSHLPCTNACTQKHVLEDLAQFLQELLPAQQVTEETYVTHVLKTKRATTTRD